MPSNFQPVVDKLGNFGLKRINSGYKDRILCKKQHFHKLAESNNYAAATQKTPTQQLTPHKIVTDNFLKNIQKQTKNDKDFLRKIDNQ